MIHMKYQALFPHENKEKHHKIGRIMVSTFCDTDYRLVQVKGDQFVLCIPVQIHMCGIQTYTRKKKIISVRTERVSEMIQITAKF